MADKMFTLRNIPLKDLHTNNGQIEGVPKNPRFIRNDKFEALKKSIEAAPEMLALRELIVYDNGGQLVIIGGNMRYRAMKEIGYREAPCKVLAKETSADKLREYIIKDNNPYGQNDWSALANEWNAAELADWGVDVPGFEYNPDTDFGQPGENGEPHDLPNGESGLPPELSGIDITPEDLPPVEGGDEVANERVIIVYPKERIQEVATLLGLKEITKVVYFVDDLGKPGE